MKHIALLASMAVLVGLASVARAQISEKDKADAVERAKEFNQRLRRTQDIEPLLQEFFTSDFLQRVQEDSGHNSLVFLEMSDKVKVRLTQSQRRRYYLASQNFFFLAYLYNCWRHPDEIGSDKILSKNFVPLQVRRILERDPFVRLFVHQEEIDNEKITDANLEKLLPRNARRVEVLTGRLEQANSAFRRLMRPVRQMSDREFEAMLSKCQDDERYNVQAATCSDTGDCPGVPKGVPLVGVSSPPFDYIDFGRVDGKLKVVRLFLWDESLK